MSESPKATNRCHETDESDIEDWWKGLPHLQLMVPTYVGRRYAEGVEVGDDQDFADPHVPVLVCSAAGVRVVLGSHDYNCLDAPDIQIERRPKGWAIFLHPLGGGDPSGYIYFLDDGRSFLVRENGLGSTDTIKDLDDLEDLRELDDLD